LLVADDYTEKYMNDNSDIFPEADIMNIVNKIKKGASAYSSLQEYVITLIKRLDKKGEGIISFKDFIDGLKSMNIYLTNHEEHILQRRFDHN